MKELSNIQNEYWQQFVSTGRIEDYLCYKSCLEEGSFDLPELKSQQGVNPYAGNNHCNRNHIETDAYRGL